MRKLSIEEMSYLFEEYCLKHGKVIPFSTKDYWKSFYQWRLFQENIKRIEFKNGDYYFKEIDLSNKQ